MEILKICLFKHMFTCLLKFSIVIVSIILGTLKRDGSFKEHKQILQVCGYAKLLWIPVYFLLHFIYHIDHGDIFLHKTSFLQYLVS